MNCCAEVESGMKVHTPEKLEPVNIWHFPSMNDLFRQLINSPNEIIYFSVNVFAFIRESTGNEEKKNVE